MVKAEDICKQECELMKEWRSKKNNKEGFIRDGAFSAKHYVESHPKILLVLKEPNAPEMEGDLRKILGDIPTNKPEDKGIGKTWNDVARWVHGIRNNLEGDLVWPNRFFREPKNTWPKNAHMSPEVRMEMLKTIVAINLKKAPGGSSSENETIEKYAKRNIDLIKKQIGIYEPDLIICGGTEPALRKADYFQDWATSEPTHKKMKSTRRDIWYCMDEEKKRALVAFSHPGAHWSSSMRYYALIDAVREINCRHNLGWDKSK